MGILNELQLSKDSVLCNQYCEEAACERKKGFQTCLFLFFVAAVSANATNVI